MATGKRDSGALLGAPLWDFTLDLLPSEIGSEIILLCVSPQQTVGSASTSPTNATAHQGDPP